MNKIGPLFRAAALLVLVVGFPAAVLQGCQTKQERLDWERMISTERTLPGARRDLAILFLHGIDGSPAHMLPLAELAQAQGIPSRVVRLPGHCEGLDEMRAVSAEDWWRKVEDEYDALAAAHDEVAVVGFSLGAGLALHLCETRPVRHAFLIAPPVKLSTESIFRIDTIRKAGAVITLVPVFKSYSDIDIEGEPRRVPVNYHSAVPSAALLQADRVVRQSVERLPDITAQLYLVHARHDPLIDRESSDIIFQTVGPARCTQLTLNSWKHSMFIEDKQKEVSDFFMSFLNSLPASPSGSR